MQVAGDCFASSQKYYHAAVTILKIKLIIFLGFGVDRSRKSFGAIDLLWQSRRLGDDLTLDSKSVGSAGEMCDRPTSHFVYRNLQ